MIVCNSCKDVATTQPHILTCELCKEGYVAPEEKPDLIVMKRKAESLVNGDSNFDDVNGSGNKRGHEKLKKERDERDKKLGKFHDEEYVTSADRLFISRLPLTITKTKLIDALTPVVKSRFSGVEKKVDGVSIRSMEWLVNKNNGAFFGSCILQMNTSETARQVIEFATKIEGGVKIDKKKLRIEFAKVKKAQQHDPFPSPTAAQGEYPPIGR